MRQHASRERFGRRGRRGRGRHGGRGWGRLAVLVVVAPRGWGAVAREAVRGCNYCGISPLAPCYATASVTGCWRALSTIIVDFSCKKTGNLSPLTIRKQQHALCSLRVPRDTRDRYKVVDGLGVGGFSSVLLVVNQTSRKYFAMKVRLASRCTHTRRGPPRPQAHAHTAPVHRARVRFCVRAREREPILCELLRFYFVGGGSTGAFKDGGE